MAGSVTFSVDNDQAPASVSACRLCGSHDEAVVQEAAGLRGVTSDCKPWPHVSRIAVCRTCGLIQKPHSVAWDATIAAVYEAYTIYHQSDGAEQEVFDPASGASASRSSRLLGRLFAERLLPAEGRMLDIGCGTGGLIRTFSALAPGWRLAGHDLDSRHRESVLRIRGVERYYTGPVADIRDRFDLITMQHVLEHIPDPVDLLRHVRELLNPGGLLFVQVPNALDNPFDLMVVDHASHYTTDTVRAAMALAGLAPVVLATDWSPKELTIVSRAADFTPSGASAMTVLPAAKTAMTDAAVRARWLVETTASASAEAVSAASDGQSFGLLGTSIAGIWLANMLGDTVHLFVDEDLQRVGRELFGRPVLHPSSLGTGTAVFIAFPPAQARVIRDRLTEKYPAVCWLVPPAWAGDDAVERAR
jgi:2-polyprenyl-3-methyl-5-hydroxy-6-metoxy-1,4-benzoquinol methylase